jgi:hypothetical protein
MLTPENLARIKPGLRGEDAALNEFLDRRYDHATQMRHIGQDGSIEEELYPTSTRFDGDKT